MTWPEHIGGAAFKLRLPRCDLIGPARNRSAGILVFRICSETVTIANKFLHSDTPTTYERALERAKEIAALRGCSRIILEPPPGE